MQIRPGVPDDASPISALIIDLARTFITMDFSPEGEANFLASADPASIARFFDEGFEYLVAEEHGRILGVVGMRDGTHLFHLFVERSVQGAGLGRDLWNQAKHRFSPADYRGDFTVNASRNAVGFYERLGFVRDGAEDIRGGVIAVPMRLVAPSA